MIRWFSAAMFVFSAIWSLNWRMVIWLRGKKNDRRERVFGSFWSSHNLKKWNKKFPHTHTYRSTYNQTFAHTLTLTSLSMLKSCVRASKVFTFRFINIFAAVRLSIFSFIVNCGVNVNQDSLPFTAKTKRTAGCQMDRGEENRRWRCFGVSLCRRFCQSNRTHSILLTLSPFSSLTTYFSIRCR